MAETPPISIRLGERRTRVDAHMLRTGLGLRPAVLDLIDLGLGVSEGSGENLAEVPGSGKSPPASAEVSQDYLDWVAAGKPTGEVALSLLAGGGGQVVVRPMAVQPKLDTSSVPFAGSLPKRAYGVPAPVKGKK